MRAKIERWQGALAQAWQAPRQADATPPSAQISPHPFGTPRFFAPAVVASLARCNRIALLAASRRRRKNHRCRDPHEFFNSLLVGLMVSPHIKPPCYTNSQKD